ncbi:B-cell linker protein isoform X2 [Ornithorhynchus anatinus]|uniref:B cell linker n=1 Tax=Ornithorhynchus anatinus TaxID=9258 RepID=A0A6I8N5Q3_ORNAN|nr:B-cell linker protein isoform X2 [Ornithorhynchus anatinus]
MANRLPFREEFESWTPSQVTDLLRQFGMHECAATVENFRIDGTKFLHLTEHELNRFSVIHQPQLQKIVHDIKKNEGGIMNKFKKLKHKAPPSVPQRDYASENVADEEEQWSDDFDSDYENPDEHSDSETYVIPGEENADDSYEPPPTEQEKRKLPPSLMLPLGEYADKRSNQRPPAPLSKPLRSGPAHMLSTLPVQPVTQKPQVPPKPKECLEDEADYVVPVEDEDENYIHPTESSLPQPAPVVNRFVKPPNSTKITSAPVTAPAPEVYEVPESEEKPSLPPNRIIKPLPPKPSMGSGGYPFSSKIRESPVSAPETAPRQALPLPRNLPSKPIHHTEKRDDNDIPSSSGARESKFHSSPAAPSPLPRAGKKINTQQKPTPILPHRDQLNVNEEKPVPVERRRGSGQRQEFLHPTAPSIAPKPIHQKPIPLPKPPEVANRTLDVPLHGFSTSFHFPDQEAGVHSRTWYAGSCDRKSAEAALYRSNRDGSFLIRKSSGHNSKQPYTLVVFYNKRVYNIPVRFIESTKQYALGREKNGEEHFSSVAEIIENHQHTPLVLIDSQSNTKDSTRLKYAITVS